MTNRISRFFALTVIVLALATGAYAQALITDIYSLTTSKQLPILEKFKERGAILETADTRNNYIYLSNPEWKGWGEMSLFERKSGGSLVAITHYNCQQPTTSYYRFNKFRGCQGIISFWELKNNQLVEVKALLPDEKSLMLYRTYEKKTNRLANSDDKLIYGLPRERKDIKIMLAGEAVYSLMWNGEKFEGSYIN